MHTRLTRRAALLGAVMLLRSPAGTAGTASSAAPYAGRAASAGADGRIADLEKRAGGRLGVAVLDTGSRARLQHRADERFAVCSTFKYVAVAAVLQRVDRGEERLDRWIAYGPQDLLGGAPLLVTAFYAPSSGSQDERDAVLRELGQIVSAAL